MRSETCICHVAEGLQKWPCSVAFNGIHIVVSISTRGPGSPRGADPVHTRQARVTAEGVSKLHCAHVRQPFLCHANGLWRVCFPPCLVRPGRRLPVQGLSEGSLGPGRENRATKFGDSRKKGKKGQWCSWSQNNRGTKCFGTTNTSCIDQSSPMARRAGGRGGSGTRGGRGEGRARVRAGEDGGTERMRGGAGARQHRPGPRSGPGAQTRALI